MSAHVAVAIVWACALALALALTLAVAQWWHRRKATDADVFPASHPGER